MALQIRNGNSAIKKTGNKIFVTNQMVFNDRYTNAAAMFMLVLAKLLSVFFLDTFFPLQQVFH